MIIVDTHCHTGVDKYEPVESLLFHMEQSGVEKAVLIQHQGTTDNSYHVDCLRNHPHRFKSAMIVEDTDTGSGIWQWADQGISGIRLDADSRAKTSDPLAHWRAAAELHLVVSAPAGPEALGSAEFQEVLQLFPELHIVIEHLGGFGFGKGSPAQERETLHALAQHSNLTIKLPGFGEFCDLPYPFQEVPESVRNVLAAFGPDRVMWGSDFPPVSCREGYHHSLEFPLEYLSDLSEQDREWVFGGTALKVWGFDERE